MDTKLALSRAREDDLYLGHNNLATKTEWKMGGAGSGNQDVLTDKAGNPAILSVMATLLGDKNYFNPEAGYDPAHETTWQATDTWVQAAKGSTRAMAESKATALLGPVPSQVNEFDQCVANLKALLSTVVPYVDQSGMIVQENGRILIKMTHEMFMLREGASPGDLAPHALSDADKHDPKANEPLDTDVLPAFRIQNWPVPENCICLRDAMVKTYCVNPLPAFMDGNSRPIVPTNYTNYLRGSIVRIYFTITHRTLRRKVPTSFFTATVDEIVVLQVHMPADLSPSHARLAARFLMNPPQEIADPKDKDENTENSSSRVKRRRL